MNSSGLWKALTLTANLVTSRTLSISQSPAISYSLSHPVCSLTMPRPPILALTHGGGPMPLLGDPSQADIIASLRTRAAAKLAEPKPAAILLITAHWEEDITKVTTAAKPKLYYDYYGFPPESYELKYPAPGAPDMAEKIIALLQANGIKAERDAERGWDHGVFVPLSLARPEADIPIVQMSVLASQSPVDLFKLGQALSSLRDENIAIVGSGSASFHNMRHFFTGIAKEGDFKKQHSEWHSKLDSTLRIPDAEKRLDALKDWKTWDGSSLMHPPGKSEHFSPLIVCAGAAGNVDEARDHVEGWTDSMLGFDMQNWAWSDIQVR